ncbi:Rv1733c family protein [Mycolicibacterium houstonense]|uniref:Rv1733c family protein n=1 Tax=Mycolicibacterium houstonense TaxID=146021 RepID=UPI003F944B99
MIHFTFGAGRCWIVRALGANPIIRLTDRAEAVGAVLVIVLILTATAATAAISTAVHDSRSHLYAEQAATRHTVQARVTARSEETAGGTGRRFETAARWPTPSGEHSGSIVLTRPAEAGDQVDILVDPTGRQVPPPPPQWQAGVDAVTVGVSVWLISIGVIGLAASLAQQWLMRLRFRKWDDELRLLKSDSGGFKGKQR